MIVLALQLATSTAIVATAAAIVDHLARFHRPR